MPYSFHRNLLAAADLIRSALTGLAITAVLLPAGTWACMSDANANNPATNPPAGAMKLGGGGTVPTNIYVNPSSPNAGRWNDSPACGTQAKPCRYPAEAIYYLAGPGTVVHLVPTSSPYTDTVLIRGKKGSFAKPITITGDGVWPNYTKILVTNGNPGVHVAGDVDENGVDLAPEADACVAYITISNLDVQATGHGQGGPVGAISIDNAHHIHVYGNYAHDSGGAGIGAARSDWLDFSGNTVLANSSDTTAAIYTSGMGTYQSKNHVSVDPEKTNKIIIASNFVGFNSNHHQTCTTAMPCNDSDGNGIIIDDGKHTQITDPAVRAKVPAYTGHTIIINNVIEGNGGAGINIYESDGVSIGSNTLAYNSTDPNLGGPAGQLTGGGTELDVSDSWNVGAWSNILVTTGGTTAQPRYSITVRATGPATGSANVFDYNLSWNNRNDAAYRYNIPAGQVMGTNNRFGNPLFKWPATNNGYSLAYYNLPVQPGSPALGFQGLSSYMYASTDVIGNARPSVTQTGANPSVTAGAYQKPVN